MNGPCRRFHRPRRRSRGAALLVAMVILTLVGTLAAGMVWQQWRGLQVESAERVRTQAAWILTGALDFGRVVLRLDGRTPGVDHLGEPWATQLQESSLSSLLAADRSNNTDAGGPEVFLRGSIQDAQARYNLRNLVDGERRLVPAEVAALGRLCESAGLAPETAQAIAEGLRAAWAAQAGDVSDEAALAPREVAQLVWLGLEPAAAAALEPLVVLLPEPTPLNLNTASAQVLAAVFGALDAGSAQRLVQARQSKPFRTLAEAQAQVPGVEAFEARRAAVGSNYFEVSGRLRAQDRQVEERVLVVRRGREIVPLWRARRALAGGST
jgi:general secretion pathway protein K